MKLSNLILPISQCLPAEEFNNSYRKAIYTHIVSTLATSPIMWAYTLCAALTFNTPIIAIVGFTCSLIHLLSSQLFRITNNLFFVTMIMLMPGVIFQSTWAFFAGGFKSHVIIWFSIIPLLAGIIEGRRATIYSTLIVFSLALIFLFLELTGFNFPNQITDAGRMISQGLLVFGWIGIVSVVIFQYTGLNIRYDKTIDEQKEKTQNLLQILLHDMGNDIQSITLNAAILKMEQHEASVQKKLTNIESSIFSLKSIIESVRSMHLLEIEKRTIKLECAPLEELVHSSLKTLQYQLNDKNQEIKIGSITSRVWCEPNILKNQVINNILSNAIKFSPDYSVIEISEIIEKDNVTLVIEDQGIGIPVDILNNLYNRSVATTRLGTRSEKGSGLGMIIVKTMLEKMNGHLDIETSTHSNTHGTKFFIILKKA